MSTQTWSQTSLNTFLDNKEIIGNAPPSRIFINRLSTGPFLNYNQGNFQIDLGKPFVSKNTKATTTVNEDQQSNLPPSEKGVENSIFTQQNDSDTNKDGAEDYFDNIDIDNKAQDTIDITENNVESTEKVSSKTLGVGSAFRKAMKGIRRNGNSPSISKQTTPDEKEQR